ncbi:MAG TPA: DMT family transporter [Melioribacteraceae bacterium]|nr:DMT family transporter [Melioribacteraceae bacterium]
MWIIFALLNPLSEAIRSLISKKTSERVDPLIIAWFNYFLPFFLFVPGLFFIELKFSYTFWQAVIISGLINLTATVFYNKALAFGNISSVMPMLSFTPLFMLVTSPILIGEFPNIYGLLGIILIVSGSYLLNFKSIKNGIFTPFKSLIKNKGTRYMLFVAFIWSISANFDKISIKSSSVYQHLIFINVVVFSLMSLLLYAKSRFNIKIILENKKNLLLISGLAVSSFIFHMVALSLTLVAYVIALKRLSGLLSVFFGYYFLKEEGIKERLLGATCMFFGVALIVLS